jgi:hypothetical protein
MVSTCQHSPLEECETWITGFTLVFVIGGPCEAWVRCFSHLHVFVVVVIVVVVVGIVWFRLQVTVMNVFNRKCVCNSARFR